MTDAQHFLNIVALQYCKHCNSWRASQWGM